MRQFEYIDHIVRYGTMREVARQLYITEPTISQQLRKFEDELGFPIFKKDGRTIKLTKEGESLLPSIKEILISVNSLENQIKEISNPQNGQIHLGIGPLTAIKYLPRLFKLFHEIYPKVKLNVIQGGVVELSELLINNQVDIVVAPVNDEIRKSLKNNDIECKVLFNDEYIAIVSTNHPLAQKDNISLHDLSYEKLILYRAGIIREHILATFGPDFKENIIFSTENNESTRELVRLGMGISIIPKFYIETWSSKDKEGICFLPFKDLRIKPDPCCFYNQNRYTPNYLKKFIEILMNFDHND
ncbi:LysR family transcriptional regulator [Bacillus sp. JJ1503]